MGSLKLKLALVLAFPAVLCGSLLGAAEPASFHLGIDFGGSHSEVLLAAGEPVQLRSQKTGEILVVRATPEAGATPKARIEVSRAMGKGLAQSTEVLELAVGQATKTRSLSSNAEIRLLSLPPASASAASEPDLKFQINLEFPGGRTVMAVSEFRPDEMVRLRDNATGVALGFRSSFTKSGKPSDVEIFSLAADGQGKPSYQLLTRVPVGGEFSVPGEKVGLPGSGSAPLKVTGSITPPMEGMWTESALAGAATEPVLLSARWDGGSWVDGVNYDGHMFRIEVPGVQGSIGIAAAPASSAKASERNVSVFQIQKVNGSEAETMRQVDTMVLREDEAARVNGFDGRLEIRLRPRHPHLPLKGICWLGCPGDVGAHGCDISCGGTDCCVGLCCPD